jgi:hypothetical protein
VVLLLDVSGSMESFATAYLHVARALATGRRAEVFAFATRLTRVTPALRLRTPGEAVGRASDEVDDRFGGTRLATSVGELVGHRSWSSAVRGAVVVVVSDGWDTDPPALLERHLGRLIDSVTNNTVHSKVSEHQRLDLHGNAGSHHFFLWYIHVTDQPVMHQIHNITIPMVAPALAPDKHVIHDISHFFS